MSQLDNAARVTTLIEPRGKFVAEAEIQKPNGIIQHERRFLDLWSADSHVTANGRETLGDVSGVHGVPISAYTREGQNCASLKQALKKRVDTKIAKYREPVERLGYNFRPLIYETVSGACHEDMEQVITERCTEIADRTGLGVGLVRFRWKQRLSCIIRRNVAHTILNRIDRLHTRSHPRTKDQDQYNELTQRVL